MSLRLLGFFTKKILESRLHGQLMTFAGGCWLLIGVASAVMMEIRDSKSSQTPQVLAEF